MDVHIVGKNLKVPERLEDYIRRKVPRAQRVLEDLKSCSVVVSELRNSHAPQYVVELTAKTGHGRVVRAETQAAEAFAAVDRAVDKLEAQVRKLKGKLVARSHGKRGSRARRSPRSSEGMEDGSLLEDAVGGVRIARTKRFDLTPMRPEEAADELEMLGHAFYFFVNEESGLPAVVYKRKSGDFGLIEPAGR